VPLPLAPLIGLALGVAFAWFARTELSRADARLLETRGLRIVIGFAALVFAPVAAYFALFHGDWAYLYLVAWRRVPSAVDLALVAAAGASVVGGFAAAAPFARAGKLPVLGGLFGAPLVLFLLLVMAFQKRLGTSASYAQFHGNFGAEPITQTELGRGILWMLAILSIGVAWCVRLLRIVARREDA
jgi:hypothetical protein